MKKTIQFIVNIPKYTVLLLIRCYQKTLSFDHSFWARPDLVRVCVFYPSCSEYTYQAIDRFGLVKGTILGSWRILRCNPFSKGGVDEIPETFLSGKVEHSHKHK
jgi:uncharacterized protein